MQTAQKLKQHPHSLRRLDRAFEDGLQPLQRPLGQPDAITRSKNTLRQTAGGVIVIDPSAYRLDDLIVQRLWPVAKADQADDAGQSIDLARLDLIQIGLDEKITGKEWAKMRLAAIVLKHFGQIDSQRKSLLQHGCSHQLLLGLGMDNVPRWCDSLGCNRHEDVRRDKAE